MMRRWPFLIPFLFMTAGLAFSCLYGIQCSPILATASFVCLLLACFQPSPALFSICTALFFFVWGLYSLHPWLSPEIHRSPISAKASESRILIEGIISSRPSVAPDGSRLTVQVERVNGNAGMESASGCLMLYVGHGSIGLMRGDRIRFVSRISLPRRLGLPGEFDYARYLAFQGISATARVESQEDIVLIRAAAAGSIQRTMDTAALQLGDAIRQSVSDERVSSVLTALLIGDQRRIPADLAAAYTRAGVNHILSISGFHVGIISVFMTSLAVWLLTRFEYPALRWNVRRIALLFIIPAMLGYLFLTGAAPATARSVIMLTVFAAALFVEREHDLVNTLLFAAFFLVALNPPTLFDVSFQLSFISLWGIIIAVPPVMKFAETFDTRILRTLFQFVAASVAASLVTLLPVLFIFKVASLNGILTNFLIVPLLGYGAVLTGFLVLPPVMLFPAAAPVLLWPAAALVTAANRFIMWCSSLPVITFHGITALDVTFFLLFMVCMTFLRTGSLLRISGILIPVCACALHVYAATTSDGKLHITMLSVGQAESILVRLPDNSVLLVDGGGYLHDTGHDFGERVLAPALGALHVRRVDRMIATHDHPDHSGGIPYIIRNFSVGEFWSIPAVSPEVRELLRSRKTFQRTLAAGDVITLPGSVVLSVLSPVGTGISGSGRDETNVNEQSLVFRLSYGSFSILFCADAGFSAEEEMLAGRRVQEATVLKVGHHGSRFSTSEAFLDRVRPKAALISAGSGIRFGLPSTRTTGLLESKNIPIYRTDRDGSIEVVSDGSEWSVSTPFKPD